MIASYSLLQSKVTDLPINLKQQFRNAVYSLSLPLHLNRMRCLSSRFAGLDVSDATTCRSLANDEVGKSTVACGTVSDRAFCADERCAPVSSEYRHRSSVIAQ